MPSIALYAQFSPGPLSAAHEKLEGTLNCLKCHGRGERALADRCLECHAEIRWLVNRQKGLHGQKDTGDCASCHREHGGREHDLVSFAEGTPEQFDHVRAGWPLDGKHGPVKCEDCHNTRRQTSGVLRLSPRTGPASESFLGLETECSSCHRDLHRGVLGTTCDECHTVGGWERVAEFDHGRTGYALTGRHADVTCEKCHPPATARPAEHGVLQASRVLSPIAHAQCTPCHRDVHSGRAGSDCARCHTTASFRTIVEIAFDHAKTDFRLEGKHVGVACEKCHKTPTGRAAIPSTGSTGPKPAPPKHERCSDCHTESHGNQLANLPERDDCASCHVVDGWKPSTFKVADHAAIDYPLEGRHAAIECAECHALGRKGPASKADPRVVGTARVAFDLGDPACAACHHDPHLGRFAADGLRPKQDGCRSCHDHRAFRPSTLTAEDHRRFEFATRGAHGAVPCDECHRDLRARAEDSDAPLRLAPEHACVSCHREDDPHRDQFARQAGVLCERCHGDDAFRPADRFDHDRDAEFALKGGHEQVACAQCHRPQRDASGDEFVRYDAAPSECKACHAPSVLETARLGGRPTGP